MNQNVAVIDALQDKVIKYVNFGATLPLLDGEQAPTTNNLPTWGYDIGHNEYDLGHDFVTVQVAANSDDPNAYVLPPPHTAEMDAIDVKTLAVDKRLQLPASCSTPHGMTIDTGQHVAFVARRPQHHASGAQFGYCAPGPHAASVIRRQFRWHHHL
jgi:hypothetical protein